MEPEAARRKAFEVFFKLKKFTISRESMECVYHNIKIISPSICVQLLAQEGVLRLLGDLGTRPTPPRGPDPAPAPRAPDPETPPPTQTLLLPSRSLNSGLNLFPPLFLSHHQLSPAFILVSAKCGSKVKSCTYAHSPSTPYPGPPTTPSSVDPTLGDGPHPPGWTPPSG